MDNESQSNDFILSAVLQKMLRMWWLFPAAIVIGGLIGSLVPLFRHSVYESTSVISTSIDFAYSGKLNDLEEDHMIVAIGNLIGSTEVFRKVQKDATMLGISLTDKDFKSMFTLSRQGYQWELSVRSDDPLKAQKLNALWLKIAEQILIAERDTSISTLKQMNTSENLEACLAQSVITDPAVSLCNLEEFQQLIDQVAALEMKVDNQTAFLLSRITTRVTQEPTFPTKPSLFNRNLTTLAGSFVGLLFVLAYFLIIDVKNPNH